MAIRFIDGFRQYVSKDEIATIYVPQLTATNADYGVDIDTAYGPFGKYAAKLASTTMQHRHVFNRIFEPAAEVCASVDFRAGRADASATTALLVGLTSAKYAQAVPSSTVAPAVILSVELGTDLICRVYHSIVTIAASLGQNKSLLGEFAPLVKGDSYNLRLRASISGDEGNATIVLNGATMDVAFNTRRVNPASGFEQAEFSAIGILNYRSATASANSPIADIVVYTNDAETPWPLPPVNIAYLVTPEANLGVGPASDATFVTVGTQRDFDLTDPVGGVLGACAFARYGAIGGNVATRAQIELVNGTEVVSVVDEDIAPGFAQKTTSLLIDPAMVTADLKVRARSID